jgi:hypothetical protein
MTNIYNLFKFIESKEPEYRTPLKLKLRLAPNEITKEDLYVEDGFGLHYADLDYGGGKDDSDITSLPDGITVNGSFYIGEFSDGEGLESLPNNLTVKENLYMSYNNNILSLPNNLEIGKDLEINNTKISSLPKDLKIGRDIQAWDTPLAKKYTEEELKKITPGVKGRIYLDIEDYHYPLPY